MTFRFGDKVISRFHDSGMGVVVGEVPTFRAADMATIGRYMVIWERSGRSSFEDPSSLEPAMTDDHTFTVREVEINTETRRVRVSYPLPWAKSDAWAHLLEYPIIYQGEELRLAALPWRSEKTGEVVSNPWRKAHVYGVAWVWEAVLVGVDHTPYQPCSGPYPFQYQDASNTRPELSERCLLARRTQ